MISRALLYVRYLSTLADLGRSCFRAPGSRQVRPHAGDCRLGAALTIAPFTRSVTTLSRSAINRKSPGQRFGRISVSDQSHCGHGNSARRGQLSGHASVSAYISTQIVIVGTMAALTLPQRAR